jgi:hypothetical protein
MILSVFPCHAWFLPGKYKLIEILFKLASIDSNIKIPLFR